MYDINFISAQILNFVACRRFRFLGQRCQLCFFNVNKRVHEVARGRASRRAVNHVLIADARACAYAGREEEGCRRHANNYRRSRAKSSPPRRGRGAHLRRDGRGVEDVAKIKAKQDKAHGEWRGETAARRRARPFFRSTRECETRSRYRIRALGESPAASSGGEEIRENDSFRSEIKKSSLVIFF